jgi:hypothetical protein
MTPNALTGNSELLFVGIFGFYVAINVTDYEPLSSKLLALADRRTFAQGWCLGCYPYWSLRPCQNSDQRCQAESRQDEFSLHRYLLLDWD